MRVTADIIYKQYIDALTDDAWEAIPEELKTRLDSAKNIDEMIDALAEIEKYFDEMWEG
ncbi:MAG: hypothetical protein KBT34_09795 [Prevotella sp.]|nr:hypothetical protein [Candidatus Prevotella equi]